MEFAGPRTVAKHPLAGYDYPIAGLYSLEGASGDEEDHSSESVILVQPSGPYPMEEILFGERLESVRAMMQKPSRVFVNGSPWAPYFFRQLGPLPTTTDTSYNCSFTWSGFYRPLFVGVACSERFKVFANADAWISGEAFFRQLGPTVIGVPPGPVAPISFHGANKGYEITIPYYSNAKFEHGRYGGDPVNSGACISRVNYIRAFLPSGSATGSEGTNLVLYHSFGPDIRLTCFQQVPTLVINDAQSRYEQNWF